jgi:hypothetical protein
MSYMVIPKRNTLNHVHLACCSLHVLSFIVYVLAIIELGNKMLSRQAKSTVYAQWVPCLLNLKGDDARRLN